MYEKRRQRLIEELQQDLLLLRNKERFLGLVASQQLSLFDHTQKQLRDSLIRLQFNPIATSNETASFEYLTRLPLDAFTKEKMNSLQSDLTQRTDSLTSLQNTSPQSLWIEELRIAREQLA
jgi:hypothetical protein